jgi:hypothetical protein
MLPYTLPNTRITILIVLLVLLYSNMLRRVREMEINHLEW